ncbi:MAG: hypothetical protein AB8E15_10390 [Bdellovibrionales bacterium]
MTFIPLINACYTIGEALSPFDSSSGYETRYTESGRKFKKRIRKKNYYNTTGPITYENHRSSIDWNLILAQNSKETNLGTDNISIFEEQDHNIINNKSLIQSKHHLKEKNTRKEKTALSFGMFTSSDHQADLTHSGIYVAHQFTPFLRGSLGASIYSSDFSYLGFDINLRSHSDHQYSPFIGGGFFMGDYKTCSEVYDSGFHEFCDKYFTGSIYVELGFQIAFKESIVNLYARNYGPDQSRSDSPDAPVLGLSIEFR